MENTIWWKIGDGLMPQPVRDTLYKSWYKTETIDLNGWSFMHALSGAIFAYLFPKQTVLMWIFIHTLWEIYQIIIGMTQIKENPKEESVDVFFDTLFSVIGFFVVKGYLKK